MRAARLAPQPASLAAGLTGSRPDAVSGVTVSIDDVSVAATVDAFGGWTARFALGAGTYTATVRAILASGAIGSGAAHVHRGRRHPRARRRERIGRPAPARSRRRSIKVNRPKPSRAVLPSRVTGRIGRPHQRPDRGAVPGRGPGPAPGSRRPRAPHGAPSASDRTDSAGKFVLSWTPKARLRLSRVALLPPEGFAGSAAAVPMAKISACKVDRARRRLVDHLPDDRQDRQRGPPPQEAGRSPTGPASGAAASDSTARAR